ncbi:hypothetical protein TNCV_2689001 [Trichonephila clavipes]|nr:hypothetical protein TNCV_2689001 [Trichonephila clavipes]
MNSSCDATSKYFVGVEVPQISLGCKAELTLPRPGFEPRTRGVEARYTTTELLGFKPSYCSSKKNETFIRRESLNSLQLNGGIIQRDLFSILLNFTASKFAVTANIKKNFRMILIDESQRERDLLRIVWKDEIDSPVKIFRLTTLLTAPRVHHTLRQDH